MPVHSYTLDQLVSLRETEASQRWPTQLSVEYKNEDGIWDPHRAFSMNIASGSGNGGGGSGGSSSGNFHRSSCQQQQQQYGEAGLPRENAKGGHGFSRDQKQAPPGIPDTESLVLGPQKQRSWTEGCHVTTGANNAAFPITKRGEEASHNSGSRGRGRGNYIHPRTAASIQQSTDPSNPGNGSSRFANLSTNNRGYRGGGPNRGGGSNTSGTGTFSKNAYTRSFSSSGGGSNYTYGSRSEHRASSQSYEDPEWFVNAPTNVGDTVDLEGIHADDTSMLEYKCHKQADSLSTRETRNSTSSKPLGDRLLMELQGFPEEIDQDMSSKNSKESSVSSPLKRAAMNPPDVVPSVNTESLKQSLVGQFEKTHSNLPMTDDPILKLQKQVFQSDMALAMELEENSKRSRTFPALIPGVRSVDELENEMRAMPTESNKERIGKPEEKAFGMQPPLSPHFLTSTNISMGQHRDLEAKLRGLILGNNSGGSTSTAMPNFFPPAPITSNARLPNSLQNSCLSPSHSTSKEAMENMLRSLILKPSGQSSQSNSETSPFPMGVKVATGDVPGSPVHANRVLTVEELESGWLRNSSDAKRMPSNAPLNKMERASLLQKEGDMSPMNENLVGGNFGQQQPHHHHHHQQQLYERLHIPLDNASHSTGPQYPMMNAGPVGSQLHPSASLLNSHSLQQALIANLLRQSATQVSQLRMVNMLTAGQGASPIAKRNDPLATSPLTASNNDGTLSNQYSLHLPNSIPILLQQQQQQQSSNPTPIASKRTSLQSPMASTSLASVLSAGLPQTLHLESDTTVSRENEHLMDANAVETLMRAIRKGSSAPTNSVGHLPSANTNGSENQPPIDSVAFLVQQHQQQQQQSSGDISLSLLQKQTSSIATQLQNVRPSHNSMPTTSLNASSPGAPGHPLTRFQSSSHPISQSLLQQLSQLSKDGNPTGNPMSASVSRNVSTQGSGYMQGPPPSYNLSSAASLASSTSRAIVKNLNSSANSNDPFNKTVDTQMLTTASPYGTAAVGFRAPVLLAPSLGSKGGSILGTTGIHLPYRGAVDISHLNLSHPTRPFFASQAPTFRANEQLIARGTVMVPVSQYVLPTMSVPPPGWPFQEKVGSSSGGSFGSNNQTDPNSGRIRTVNEIEAEVLTKHLPLPSPKGAPSKSIESE